MKTSVSLAQAFAVCYGCRVRHPVKSVDAYRDFAHNHQRPTCLPSLLDRDVVHEVVRSPLAAWDPDKTILVGEGLDAMLALRARDGSLGALEDYRPNADIKNAYGSEASVTCTLASLASSATAGQEWTAVDFTSSLYPDALWRFTFKLQAGSPANDKATYVYFAGSADGTNYGDPATGSNAAITLRAPTNLIPCATVRMPDSGALSYKAQPIATAWAFAGAMPRKMGGAIQNYSGVAFDATEGNHAKAVSGVYSTVI